MKKVFLTAALIIGFASSAFAIEKNEIQGIRVLDTKEISIVDGKTHIKEFYWQKCPHCYHLEGPLNDWIEKNKDNVVFEKIPVAWSESHIKDGDYYLVAQVLHKNGQLKNLKKFSDEVFKMVFVDKFPLTDENVNVIFKQNGVEESQWKSIKQSFYLKAEENRVKSETKKYGIVGVPAFVIDGKYYTDIGEAQGVNNLFSILDSFVKKNQEDLKESKEKE